MTYEISSSNEHEIYLIGMQVFLRSLFQLWLESELPMDYYSSHEKRSLNLSLCINFYNLIEGRWFHIADVFLR